MPENESDPRPYRHDGTDRRIHNVDARTLRAVAHPLRLRLLNALREFGPATASGLGERLGESSGATSYHLRQMAEAGLVEDAPELGKGRERWWRSVHDGSIFESSAFRQHADPAVRGAIDFVLHETATSHAEELNAWLGTVGDWSDAWQRSWDMSDFKIRLTPELAMELSRKMHELVESYRDTVPEDTEDSAVVRTHLHLFPRRSE
ncbi:MULTISPECIES: winged helix-turn-helix domain-containing protein [Streptomyces]|uniref:Winged helix-turn-helix transcriptional regulator n=1 Tax=Streptomyces globisporus TaxID=1908 RepID=A0A927BJ35_STRGL|nr:MULTISPECIES: winged helix-turn-helix domain-containing protein [Streptomyces]MBD2827681.1 winged helix-turn-helix transcriptional regulator [Streptomyces globisporus]KOU05150.1 ArsR family transcriptional regulator [Streptomyces sp. NRRL F-2295]MDP9949656.1 DNA-binding transcriptional ArsR family regulator [Streptomyces sp. DSM 41269]QRV56706.1 winged helix-turn-helix transcriptional regulator [Streptomyces californicus]QSS90992.1 winged helix-turn-helix transcriptional regulator [Streptom